MTEDINRKIKKLKNIYQDEIYGLKRGIDGHKRYKKNLLKLY